MKLRLSVGMALTGIGERFTYRPGIDEPLVGQRQPQIYYYEADGLGSVTSLTDPTGATAATYTYDSFGLQTKRTGERNYSEAPGQSAAILP